MKKVWYTALTTISAACVVLVCILSALTEDIFLFTIFTKSPLLRSALQAAVQLHTHKAIADRPDIISLQPEKISFPLNIPGLQLGNPQIS